MYLRKEAGELLEQEARRYEKQTGVKLDTSETIIHVIMELRRVGYLERQLAKKSDSVGPGFG